MQRGHNKPNPRSADGRAYERRILERFDEEMAEEDRVRRTRAYRRALELGHGFVCGECHRAFPSSDVGFDARTGRCFHFDSKAGERHSDVYPDDCEYEG